jgi:hypothetical protein
MHTAEYKFQIGQTVYNVDYDNKEIRTVTVLQVTIDLYSDSRGDVAQENTYTIHLLTGMDCSENVECDESQLFETAAEAAAALAQVLN